MSAVVPGIGAGVGVALATWGARADVALARDLGAVTVALAVASS